MLPIVTFLLPEMLPFNLLIISHVTDVTVFLHSICIFMSYELPKIRAIWPIHG